jgi:NAD(P)-dependent dehydrogenase (short-subunit alcohol dehydrogenase family)
VAGVAGTEVLQPGPADSRLPPAAGTQRCARHRRRQFAARADHAETREAWYGRLAREKKIPLARLGEPEEPVRAIVFLGSPAASYITGASLEIPGGVSRHI